MSIAYHLRKETKFKATQLSNVFTLDIEVLDPGWACVYINRKYMDIGTYKFDKNNLLLKKAVEKGTEIKVRDFEKVGKTKRQKTKEN